MPQAQNQTVNWILSVAPVYRWAISLTFVAIVVALSISPGVARPGDSIFVWLIANTATPVQKTMHVAVYAVLAFLWVWTLQSIETKSLRFLLTFLITASLGSLLEWQQTSVPGRYGTIADLLLNLVGTLIGMLIALLIL